MSDWIQRDKKKNHNSTGVVIPLKICQCVLLYENTAHMNLTCGFKL